MKTNQTNNKQTANRYGIKLGDLFGSISGYSPNASDFFQVVELIDGTTVRVKHVTPNVKDVKRDELETIGYTVESTGEMLEPATKRIRYIDDLEGGEIVRKVKRSKDGQARIFLREYDQTPATLIPDGFRVEKPEGISLERYSF